MKTLLLVIPALVIVGIGLFIVMPSLAPTSPSPTTPPSASATPLGNNLNPSGNQGSYITYSSGVLDKNQGKRRVLFFYANWCPTCRPADASFTQNIVKIPADVILIRVNYNDTETDQEEKDLAAKYGVTYQHTYVQIDENGKEIGKWNGGQIEELLTNLK